MRTCLSAVIGLLGLKGAISDWGRLEVLSLSVPKVPATPLDPHLPPPPPHRCNSPKGLFFFAFFGLLVRLSLCTLEDC